ncbi:MAG: hypothetical protein FWH43_00920 [Endomicrobia bacterium]|nr:hypothetical protein [Endomicrobiia bacterium]
MKNRVSFFSILCICVFVFAGCGGKIEKERSRASYYNDLINDALNVSYKQLGLELQEDELSVYGIIMMQNIGNIFVAVSAAYLNGESAEIFHGGNCFISTGEKGVKEGVSKVLYNTVKSYLDYYKKDFDKYWKNKSVYEMAQNLMMTTFITENNEDVRNNVIAFVAAVKNNVSIPENIDNDGSIPGPGEVKIVFLTNKGKFFMQGSTEELLRTYEISSLFRSRTDISNMIFQRYAPPPPNKTQPVGNL